jgi:hypothetical protein
MTGRPWQLVAAVALAVPVCLGACGGPDTDPAAEVGTTRAAPDVATLVDGLTAAGVDAVGFDAHTFIVKEGAVQVPVFLEDGGASLQAIFPHTGVPGRASSAAIQRWNATRRFGRAYRDDEGLPVLASDLLLGPDVGPQAVATWSRLLLDMATLFRDEVWPSPLPGGDPVNE